MACEANRHMVAGTRAVDCKGSRPRAEQDMKTAHARGTLSTTWGKSVKRFDNG